MSPAPWVQSVSSTSQRTSGHFSKTQRPIPWVFSLSEVHTAVYGEHVAGAAIIDFQDADVKWFAKLALSPDEKSEWTRQVTLITGPRTYNCK